jgi:hypothetical protein
MWIVDTISNPSNFVDSILVRRAVTCYMAHGSSEENPRWQPLKAHVQRIKAQP